MLFKLNKDNWSEILVALEKLKHFASHYEWVGKVDWDKGTRAIWCAVEEGNAYYMSGYLVLVAEVIPWYTKDKLLQEWLVIKMEAGNLADIPRYLLSVACARGCKAVITADSSPVQLVAKAYQEAGYKPLTNSFFKVVPTWDSSDKPQPN